MNDHIRYGEADFRTISDRQMQDKIETAAVTITYRPDIGTIREVRQKFSQPHWLKVLETRVDTAFKSDTSARILALPQISESLLTAVSGIDTALREKHIISYNNSILPAAFLCGDIRIFTELTRGISSTAKKELFASAAFRDFITNPGKNARDQFTSEVISALIDGLDTDETYSLFTSQIFEMNSPFENDRQFTVTLPTYLLYSKLNRSAELVFGTMTSQQKTDLIKNERNRAHLNSLRAVCLNQNTDGLTLIQDGLSDTQWESMADRRDIETIAKTGNPELFSTYKRRMDGDTWFQVIQGTEALFTMVEHDSSHLIRLLRDHLSADQWSHILMDRKLPVGQDYVSPVYFALHNKKSYNTGLLKLLRKDISPASWQQAFLISDKREGKTLLHSLDTSALNFSDTVTEIRDGMTDDLWFDLLRQHQSGRTLLLNTVERYNGSDKQYARLTEGLTPDQIFELISLRTYDSDKTMFHSHNPLSKRIFNTMTPDQVLLLAKKGRNGTVPLLESALQSSDLATVHKIFDALHHMPVSELDALTSDVSTPFIQTFKQLCLTYELQHFEQKEYFHVIRTLPALVILEKVLRINSNKIIRLINNSEKSLAVSDKHAVLDFIALFDKLGTNEIQDLADSIRGFSDQFLMPLVFLKSGTSELSEKETTVLREKLYECAVQFMLFTGSNQSLVRDLPLSLSQLFSFSKQFHRAHEGIPNSLLDNASEWMPLLENATDTTYVIDGETFIVHNLTSMRELQQESATMNHCVGRGTNYAQRCQAGISHILSIRKKRKNNTYETVSTAEIMNKDDAYIENQHRGHSNDYPSDGAIQTLHRFLKDIKEKKLMVSQVHGETKESKARAAKNHLISIIGFDPTPAKVRMVFEYYVNMTWDEGKSPTGRNIRSLFCPAGESMRNHLHRYVRTLYLDVSKKTPAETGIAADIYAPLLDELLDQVISDTFHAQPQRTIGILRT